MNPLALREASPLLGSLLGSAHDAPPLTSNLLYTTAVDTAARIPKWWSPIACEATLQLDVAELVNRSDLS